MSLSFFLSFGCRIWRIFLYIANEAIYLLYFFVFCTFMIDHLQSFIVFFQCSNPPAKAIHFYSPWNYCFCWTSATLEILPLLVHLPVFHLSSPPVKTAIIADTLYGGKFPLHLLLIMESLLSTSWQVIQLQNLIWKSAFKRDLAVTVFSLGSQENTLR